MICLYLSIDYLFLIHCGIEKGVKTAIGTLFYPIIKPGVRIDLGCRTPPSGFFKPEPSYKKTFLVHGEAKSGPFGRCRGVSLPWHPLATVTAHSASEKVNL